MGGRTMPTECEHGAILDWGDFGGDSSLPESCGQCEAITSSGLAYEAELQFGPIEGQLVQLSLLGCVLLYENMGATASALYRRDPEQYVTLKQIHDTYEAGRDGRS